MKLHFTFRPNASTTILHEPADILFNLASFCSSDGCSATEAISQLEVACQYLHPNDSFVFTYDALNDDIISSLDILQSERIAIYENLNTLLTRCISFCAGRKQEKVTWTPNQFGHAAFDGTPSLLVRWGIVELRVLDNFLHAPNQCFSALRSVSENLSDEQAMYFPNRAHWLSSEDFEFNLKALMTNAGFYAGNSFRHTKEALVEWAYHYLHGVSDGILFPVPGGYPFFFGTKQTIYNWTKARPNYLNFPTPESFYISLSEKSILLVTPFAEQIQSAFSENKTFQLYKDLAIPNFRIKTIKAPISTYPNRPGSSWLESFRQLTAQIDYAFKQERFDLFFAAAGCYGIPLCHYAFKTFGCMSIYYGNHINTLFGILQRCSDDFMKSSRIEENWVHSDLSKFANVDRIDDGRYI